MTEFFRKTVNRPRRLVGALIANWAVCGGLYSLIESKGPITGLWWALVTGSTVGYGDYSPVSTPGRGVAAWFMVTTALMLLLLGAHFTAYVLPNPHLFTDSEQKWLIRCVRRIIHLQVVAIREQRETRRQVAELHAAMNWNFPSSFTATSTANQPTKEALT